jgi:glucosamine--fructose-6-phosphate aminotransferase (isomerizing)
MAEPGALLAAEIAEQPAALARLLTASSRGQTAELARRVRAFAPRFVLLAARGTSDHAALYAKYLAEVDLELPAGLVSPSSLTVYDARPDLAGVLFITVSQSGGSPDLVDTTAAARERGALTLAVTNNAQSPLAQAAELHLDVLAGPERAVAATKSYTSQLLALHLLVDAMRGGDGDDAVALPDQVARTLDLARHVPEVAGRYLTTQRLVTTGRGLAYPTAREAALKIMETTYLSAQGFSAADLLHGPVAMIDETVPVIAVVSQARSAEAVRPALARLAELGADVLTVGPHEGAGLPVCPGVPERLAPVVDIVPLQLLALNLALQRGKNPDAPRGLQKVTSTH